jgi:CheY-like chemotaxis protein
MNLKGKTILIAEDENSGFAYLEAILKRTGVTLLYAKNGLEAVEIFRANPEIDLVLMDLQMPGLDGFQARAKISEINPHTPQIAQTAFAMVEDEIKTREAGFNGYICKPIRKNDLLNLIGKLLNLPPNQE